MILCRYHVPKHTVATWGELTAAYLKKSKKTALQVATKKAEELHLDPSTIVVKDAVRDAFGGFLIICEVPDEP